MNEQEYIAGMLDRSALFFTQTELDKVRNSTFAIAGLGGVGAITAELIALWGVKKFRLFDKDCYDPSNLNRQLFATSKTLNKLKVEVAAKRIKGHDGLLLICGLVVLLTIPDCLSCPLFILFGAL